MVLRQFEESVLPGKRGSVADAINESPNPQIPKLKLAGIWWEKKCRKPPKAGIGR